MGGLEDRVNEAMSVACKLTLATACCGIMMCIGYKNLASTGMIGSQKKEKVVLSYESEEARELAYSAIRRCGRNEQELYVVDRDNDGKITEAEVLFYVRNH